MRSTSMSGTAAGSMIVLLAVALMVAEVSATNYYFSPQGSDSNSGTSPAAPWQHLNHSLTNLQPGDMVLLEYGGIWTEEQLQIAFANGVTVTAYGNDSLPRPAILLSRPAQDIRRDCISLMDSSNFTISNIHVSGCSTGLHIWVTKNVSNVEVNNLYFSDILAPTLAFHPADSNWATAIDVQGNGALNNIIVHHCIGLRLDVFFSPGAAIFGLTLDSNTVSQCGGNCIGMSGHNMLLSNSVFLRDTPTDTFLYGTTDVIVGTVVGNNSIQNCDFIDRGEYSAAPDGCAIDFETSAVGFRITGCTISRSYGAGLMVFGHETTSQNFTIDHNNFLHDGCIQPRSDRDGIAFMCPGGNKPSGTVAYNNFITCPDSQAFLNTIPNCSEHVNFIGNTINTTVAVEQPELTYNPPDPSSTAPSVVIPVLAVCNTPNAVIRYTLDGSRPSETSPVFPSKGLDLVWPGPDIAINVRAFAPGMLPSPTQGTIVERRAYTPRGAASGSTNSQLDGVTVNGTTVQVTGWAVDYKLPGGGVPPVSVAVYVDFTYVMTVVANGYREDLVKAGVAPNPYHGFDVSLPPATVKQMQSGKHVVEVYMTSSPSCATLCEVNSSPMCAANPQSGEAC